MITALLLLMILQSPKGAGVFSAKAIVVPPTQPTVVLQMPAGFNWSTHEVHLEKCYDLQFNNWFMYGYVTNGVPVTVPYDGGHSWYRLSAQPRG